MIAYRSVLCLFATRQYLFQAIQYLIQAENSWLKIKSICVGANKVFFGSKISICLEAKKYLFGVKKYLFGSQKVFVEKQKKSILLKQKSIFLIQKVLVWKQKSISLEAKKVFDAYQPASPPPPRQRFEWRERGGGQRSRDWGDNGNNLLTCKGNIFDTRTSSEIS